MDAVALAFIIPFVTFVAHQGIAELRKFRSYKRLKNDPLFCSGATFHLLETESRDKPLLVNGHVHEFSRTYVMVYGYAIPPGGINEDGATPMKPVYATFTCMEFEKLTPLWEE